MRAATYESAQHVRDVRTFLDFYFTQSRELSQVILERDAYMLLYQIFKWDTNDVRDLRSWVRDFNHVCKTIGYLPEDLLNLSRMTATPVPEDVVRYPVYAVDKHGYCLCGKNCDDIMYIDEIREEMESREKRA